MNESWSAVTEPPPSSTSPDFGIGWQYHIGWLLQHWCLFVFVLLSSSFLSFKNFSALLTVNISRFKITAGPSFTYLHAYCILTRKRLNTTCNMTLRSMSTVCLSCTIACLTLWSTFLKVLELGERLWNQFPPKPKTVYMLNSHFTSVYDVIFNLYLNSSAYLYRIFAAGNIFGWFWQYHFDACSSSVPQYSILHST